ncbi:MAG: TonB-dependent receptor [Gammaproteobacteria bacterium]
MTRSKRRKLERTRVTKVRAVLRGIPLASAILAASPAAFAQAAGDEVNGLEEVIVSAQKRDENLQTVPLSIQAIGTEKLEQLHIGQFEDYVKFLPSVTFQAGGAGGGPNGPGFSRVLMRGVSSDSNLNHSGPLPTVGTYLDEQPITTIQGAIDLHLYDIARVEALAGPQGTLYGASSEAGTVRIITNKPDPSGFKAGYEIQANTIANGDPGGLAQGFVNIPVSESAAIRLVAWGEHKGGFLDNVAETRTFPQFGVTINNDGLVEKNFNDVTTYGARAALKVDLNENWTITPVLMAQKTKANGFFSENPALGDYKVAHFRPDDSDDHFVDAALTLEGKISNFDLTYAGAFLKRDDHTRTDYSDYSLAYDISIPSYTAPIVDNSGNHIDPTQWIQGIDRYQKQSHELRLASPVDWRLRFIVGAFYQRQSHNIEQRYVVNNLATSLWVTGWPDTWWLTEQVRVDRDYAVFGEATFDVTDNLSLTAGIRHFKYDNSLGGFRGFGIDNPLSEISGLGEAGVCDASIKFYGAPCLSFDKNTSDSGNTPKFTATYRFDPTRLVYATYSKGFRPGGINRVGDLPPYGADFLKNYEIGWKTTWAGNRLRFNGAVFREDWQDFQFAFLGAFSLTRIANAGAARVKGFESELSWAVNGALTISGGLTLLEPEITENYCGAIDENGGAITDCEDPPAPKGTQLPATSKTKGNVVARYAFPLAGFEAHAQAAFIYQSAQWADLRISERNDLGQQPGFGSADFAFGVGKADYSVELFVSNAFDKRADVYRFTQCNSCSIVANYRAPFQPRTVGVTFNQKF